MADRVVLFENNSFESLYYSDFSVVKLSFPMDSDNPIRFKKELDELRIILGERPIDLKCDQGGAAFKIKRLIDFGVSQSK